MNTTIDDILRSLRKVKRCGSGFVACCPAHEDRNPSLSLTERDGRILFHCFAGCSIDSIKSALGVYNEVAYTLPKPKPEPRPIIHNPLALYKGWERETDPQHLDGFAMSLGVDTDALRAIGCAWARTAWAFPMRDDHKSVIGIRLRGEDGKKWAIKGSRQGLFIPTDYPYCVDDGTMYIVEGPTDLAAAMTIGLYAIGRPSCLGQEPMIKSYLQNTKVRRIVIVSDNDTPGLTGARRLQQHLARYSCVFTPPTKDMREYVQRGGTAMMIEASTRDLIWKAA